MRKMVLAALALCMPGCASSPSVPILGAFFPAWLLCLTGAVFLTLIARAALLRSGRAASFGPPVLVYPLLTAMFTLIFWVVFFSN